MKNSKDENKQSSKTNNKESLQPTDKENDSDEKDNLVNPKECQFMCHSVQYLEGIFLDHAQIWLFQVKKMMMVM